MKIHKSITADRVIAAVEESMVGLSDPGFCTRCGEDAFQVEPDARGNKCEGCGAASVFGAEELLFEMEA